MSVRSLVAGALAAAALTTAPVAMATPAQAASCASGSEVRQQVATFVHSLRDDVPSARSRAAVRRAFVESVRTARGAKAGTAEERRALGREISALARQLHDAEGRVERKALVAEIHALQEQKRQDRVSAEDVEAIEADVVALRRAIIGRVDTTRERSQVATFARTLVAQLTC